MENLLGVLKIKLIRGINLVVKDTQSSDPYVTISMGSQKVKSRTVKRNCNPEWNDEMTLAVHDLNTPIQVEVFDKDTFSDDDKMGDANVDIKPYIEYLRAGLTDLPEGTVVHNVIPDRQNCLADSSPIFLKNGRLVQDMILRLKNVTSGEVEIQLEWVDVPGSRGLAS